MSVALVVVGHNQAMTPTAKSASRTVLRRGCCRRITQDEYDKKARQLKGRQTELALRIGNTRRRMTPA